MVNARLYKVIGLLICAVLPLALYKPARAASTPGSAVVIFTNLSQEPTLFDVYLDDGTMHPVFTKSGPQKIGGSIEIPAADWTFTLVAAGSAAASKPLYTQTISLNAGDHMAVIAFGSLSGKDADAFTLRAIPLDYANIPDGDQRVEVLNLLPNTPEVNVRIESKFIATHLKYGDSQTVTGFWGGHNIYASSQDAILPDDQNIAHIFTLEFKTGDYHLLIVTGPQSDPKFFDLYMPLHVTLMRFVNAIQNSPALDFNEGIDQFGAMQNLNYSDASPWIALENPGLVTTSFEVRNHGDALASPAIAVSGNVQLKPNDSVLVVAYGSYNKTDGSGIHVASFSVPRGAQQGKATVQVVNLIANSNPISLIDNSGAKVKDMSDIKPVSLKWITGVDPLKIDVKFADDKTGKVVLGFDNYNIDGDQIQTFLLVGSIDDPQGIAVHSASDVFSSTGSK